MYKDYYKKEIEEISKILEKDNIHITEIQTKFKTYIYDEFNPIIICTDLILTLNKNPKYITLMNLEEIETYIKYNLNKPGFFSLRADFFTDDGIITEKIDYNLFDYKSNHAIITIDTDYKKSEYWEKINIEITKQEQSYFKPIMINANNVLKNLEKEFKTDLSDKKFDLNVFNLTTKEKTLRESWSKIYNSPIFGEYTLKFKIYETNYNFSITIENSLTNKIYTIEDGFTSYNDTVSWMNHIKNTLIPFNNKELEKGL